ncbi:MAG: hypothetical protein AAF289_13755 [Cyanobacteria bacterium P01_A01_bin.135]
MKIIYKEVVTLALWHDFYLGQPASPPTTLPSNYDISDALRLIPTADCERVLRNLRWVFRPQPTGGRLFANVDDAPTADNGSSGQFQTVVAADRPYRLTFWLTVRDRSFVNYTNLPLTDARHQLYYFSNLWNNQGHAIFLTRPLPPYEAGAAYQLGQMVSQGGNTLEALQPLQDAPGVPTPQAWETLPDSQYVSAGDRLPKQGRYLTRTIASANPGNLVQFQLKDSNEQMAFSREVEVPEGHAAGEPFPVSLDLAGLSPGRYRFQDQAPGSEFLFTARGEPPNAFALVEILLNSDLISPAIAPLQPQGQQTLIQPQTYVIRFKNRATRWRYRYQQPHGCDAASLPNSLTLIDAHTYVTAQPVGLQTRPRAFFNDCRDDPLPAPTTAQIKPELSEDRQVTQIFSDIYL